MYRETMIRNMSPCVCANDTLPLPLVVVALGLASIADLVVTVDGLSFFLSSVLLLASITIVREYKVLPLLAAIKLYWAELFSISNFRNPTCLLLTNFGMWSHGVPSSRCGLMRAVAPDIKQWQLLVLLSRDSND